MNIQLRLSQLNQDEKTIFNKLQKDGPLTKKDLINIYHYSPTTLSRLISSLKNDGLIVETGFDDSSGGRRPSLFDINAGLKYIVGIDIDRSKARIVLCDLKMIILASTDTAILRGISTPLVVFQYIESAVGDLIAANNLTADDILGIGMGIPGPYNRDTGRTGILEDFPSPDWSNYPIMDTMRGMFRWPIYIDNGTYAAVIGEYFYGNGKNYRNILYLNCGIGISSGLISAGKLHRAANNLENAISHMTINVMGERCSCGKRGCLRCYASILPVVESVRKRISSGEATLIQIPVNDIWLPTIAAAAEQGDKICIDELKTAGEFLGLGLANYITLLNPNYVVIGGLLPALSDIYYQAAVESANKNLYVINDEKVTIVKGGSFGKNAITVGSAAMLCEYLLHNDILI